MNKQNLSQLNILPDNPQTEQLQTLLAEHIRHLKTGTPLFFQGFERCPGHLSQVREALIEMCIDPLDGDTSRKS